METLDVIVKQTGTRLGLSPTMLPTVLRRAESVFFDQEPPSPVRVERWLVDLREHEAPDWFATPPKEPEPDLSQLSPVERLSRYRAAHPQTPARPPLVLTAEQTSQLAGLPPGDRLTAYRRLVAVAEKANA